MGAAVVHPRNTLQAREWILLQEQPGRRAWLSPGRQDTSPLAHGGATGWVRDTHREACACVMLACRLPACLFVQGSRLVRSAARPRIHSMEQRSSLSDPGRTMKVSWSPALRLRPGFRFTACSHTGTAPQSQAQTLAPCCA
jgi:hypothetical protein